jgi:hypothetical protein
MQLSRLILRVAGILLALFVVLLSLPVRPASAQHGCDPGNLIPNCNFDGPYYAPPEHPDWRIPEGWAPFVLGGSLAYWQAEDTYWGPPSLQMVSDGDVFRAGVFTQVNGLQAGATYKASAGWFAPTHPPDDYFCRKLGIDPKGGTNPQAAEVLWGPTYCGPGRLVNYPPPGPNIDVSAVAQSSTVTVFAYVEHTYSTGMNYIFLDAVGLYQDSSAPIQAPPTAVPPTVAPAQVRAGATSKPAVRLAPTKTAVPTATATPSPTMTASVTSTPVPTSTPTNTPTPTQTHTPTATPTSTLPPRPKATPGASTATAAVADSTGPASPVMLCGGLGALGCAGLLGIALIVSKRR